METLLILVCTIIILIALFIAVLLIGLFISAMACNKILRIEIGFEDWEEEEEETKSSASDAGHETERLLELSKKQKPNQ